MKICACRGCKTEIKDDFRFCWVHRNNIYIDHCNIHGKTNFRNFRCILCKQNEKSIYTLRKSRSTHRICVGEYNAPRYCYKYIKELYEKRFKENYGTSTLDLIISSGGLFSERKHEHAVYGLFDKKTKECYYIGQTFDFLRRKEEHFDCLDKTHKGITKNIPLWYKNLPEKKNIALVCLYHYPDDWFKTLSLVQKLYVLAVAEQWGMDTYKPSQNVVQARMTQIIKK